MALVARLIAAIIFIVVSATAIIYLHARTLVPTDQVFTINSGSFSPENRSSFEDIQLPHDWLRNNLEITDGWYRFHFENKDPARELYAIYFPTVSQNVAVYLNGSEVGNGGSLNDPVARNWPRPLILPIIPELILEGDNELLILLVSSPVGRGLLPEFYIGARDDLLPAYWSRFKLKVNATTSICIVLFVYGVLLLLIPLRLRTETLYFWGGVIILSLAGHTLPMIVTSIPVSPFLWELWKHICAGFSTLFILYFAHRFVPKPHPALEKTLTVLVIVSIVASLLFGLLVSENLYFKWGSAYWTYLSLFIGTVAAFNFIRSTIEFPTGSNLAVMASGGLLLGFATHDGMFLLGYLSRESGYLVHYANPIFAIVFSVILFIRFADARKNSDDLNKDLETRIKEKAEELENTYQQLTQLERNHAASQERERLTRDMHDGLGGYLTGALAIAETGPQNDTGLLENLKDANEELRMMIDIADSENDITMAIGSMRDKIQRRLAASGIDLSWDIQELPDNRKYPTDVIVNLSRIIQECINNILKHSNADVVMISLTEDRPDRVALVMSDNGICERTFRPSGHGIKNIRDRANLIDAEVELDVKGSMGGLSVTILLPESTTVTREEQEATSQLQVGPSS